jgi:hypothetical protein
MELAVSLPNHQSPGNLLRLIRATYYCSVHQNPIVGRRYNVFLGGEDF